MGAFRRWLERQVYAERTIVGTLQDVAVLQKKLVAGTPLRKTLRKAVQRLDAYAAEVPDVEARRVAREALERLKAAQHAHVRGGLQRGVRVEKRIDDAKWSRLVLAIRGREGLPMRALDVMAETGLRVNDVLQVRPSAVFAALKGGGTFPLVQKGGEQLAFDPNVGRDAWQRLVAEVPARAWPLTNAGKMTLAQLISPGSKHTGGGPNGPYQAVRRALRALCQELGIDERVWTHRFRHTFATRLADATGDVRLVAAALGHSGLATVGTYVGAAAPARVAAAITKISVR